MAAEIKINKAEIKQPNPPLLNNKSIKSPIKKPRPAMPIGVSFARLERLLQQSQNLLSRGVGLRQHGGTGLLQNLCAGQVCRLLSVIGIFNP